MGTFHAKYMIVDRRIACVSSNNIQDRVNLEMNIHLEGPIVDAFYDMALLSWAEPMNPPLPLLQNPAAPVEGQSQPEDGDCFDQARKRREALLQTSADAIPTHPGACTSSVS